ncbi:hypothetical protein EB796_001817 [Bugula neritina]|uniref:Uncharacterized protein n=1 Tax=Bugula neritina TaxID=10212 RepID=A0A7J7KNX4_BUGNE|nr:hypothetical protein EB796_001817 [Bugula neritina]
MPNPISDQCNTDEQIQAGVTMEKELKSSIAKLYHTYDSITDEYDRLYDIVDSVREDYTNTKSLFIYYRYHEFKRLIKNAIRKWRSVEKRNSLAASRKQSNTSFAMALTSGSLNRSGAYLPGIPEESSGSYSRNLNYKSRNQKMKNLLCKLSIDYENAKGHALHLWGRYKELKQMIVEVINSDI